MSQDFNPELNARCKEERLPFHRTRSSWSETLFLANKINAANPSVEAAQPYLETLNNIASFCADDTIRVTSNGVFLAPQPDGRLVSFGSPRALNDTIGQAGVTATGGVQEIRSCCNAKKFRQ